MIEKIKRNGANLILLTLLISSLLVVSIESFKSMFGNYYPYFAAVLIILYGISAVFIKPKEVAPEIMEIKIGVKDTQNSAKRMEAKIDKIDSEITKETSKKEENYERTQLVADLINHGLISIREVDKSVPDKKFFTVFCRSQGFPQNLPSSIKKKSKDEKSKFMVNYYNLFEKLGFVRLVWNRPYFIIAEDNVYPEKLRNLENLSNYFINKIGLSLIEKWNLVMDYSREHSPRFYKQRQGKENPLDFNMLIVKSNLRDMRYKFIKTNIFDPKLSNELASITKLNKIRIEEDSKIGIKNFVLKSSIYILVLRLETKDRKKILDLEPIFTKSEADGGLGIEKFYDYHQKPKEKIIEILKKKFDDETKVNEYADLIVKNSKQYKEDLTEMGIEV